MAEILGEVSLCAGKDCGVRILFDHAGEVLAVNRCSDKGISEGRRTQNVAEILDVHRGWCLKERQESDGLVPAAIIDQFSGDGEVARDLQNGLGFCRILANLIGAVCVSVIGCRQKFGETDALLVSVFDINAPIAAAEYVARAYDDHGNVDLRGDFAHRAVQDIGKKVFTKL